MKYQYAKGQLLKLSEKLNYAMMISLMLLFSNVILASFSGYALLHQKRIITPFNSNVSYVASDSQVDAKYLDLMSVNLLDAHLDVTPENVQANNQLLLSYISPDAYAGFLKQLNEKTRIVKKEKMSSTFYRDKMQSYPNKLMTVVSGTLVQWVGYRQLQPMKKNYVLLYDYDGGRLKVRAIKEITHDKN